MDQDQQNNALQDGGDSLEGFYSLQGINRTILSWLRLWDEVVFGCPAPLKNMASGGGTGEKLKKDRNSKDGTAPKGKKFEKKKEFQNPDLLASVEVSQQLLLATVLGQIALP